MNREINHPYKLAISIIVCLNLLSAYPFTFCLYLPIPDVKITTFLFIFIYTLILLRFKTIKLLPSLINQLTIIQICLWLIFLIIQSDGVYITRISYLVNTYLILLCLYQYNNGIIKFIYTYNNLILLMAIGGCIIFFLVAANLINPIFTYSNVDTRIGYFYGLTCTNAKFFNFIRYSGFFDEPGAMAAWGIYALLLNKFTLNNIKFENSLLVALCFTFSMAYYIQAFLYIVFLKLKKQRQFIVLGTIIFVAFLGVLSTKGTDLDIYKMTFERFEADDSGKLKGDNRSNLGIKAKKYFLLSPLVGHGPTYIQDVDYMGDNPYETLASDGIIGSIIIYLPLLILLYPFNKQIFFAVMVLMAGYMQRPFHNHLIHPLMMYLFTFAAIQYRKKYGHYNSKNFCRNRQLQRC